MSAVDQQDIVTDSPFPPVLAPNQLSGYTAFPVQPIANLPSSLAAPLANASLYIGELDPSVTEALLFDEFNKIGPVASVRVCRDAVTRRSLGYAYVNYHSHQDGERALDVLNYSIINGKACRIMWSQRDPSMRKRGAGNVFIKNLDPSIDNKALHDTFASFGTILSCKVATDNGLSKGYGFVHYETNEQADLAIRSVNGMLLNDRQVYVGQHIPRKERQSKYEEMKARFTNVYVKNLIPEVTDAELRAKFEPFGMITSCAVVMDYRTAKSRGFGFINFNEHDQAANAVRELNDSEWNGRQLFVSRAQKKSEREEELKRRYLQIKEEKYAHYQGTNLYIKNLGDAVDDERLVHEFSPFGSITSAKVMCDEKGKSKGFAFVCFTTPDEATRAVTEMNGRMLCNKPLYVSLAQRKEDRRNQLQALMAHRHQSNVQQMVGLQMDGMYPTSAVYYNTGMQPVYPGTQAGRNVLFPNNQYQPGLAFSGPRWSPGGVTATQKQQMMVVMPGMQQPYRPMQAPMYAPNFLPGSNAGNVRNSRGPRHHRNSGQHPAQQQGRGASGNPAANGPAATGQTPTTLDAVLPAMRSNAAPAPPNRGNYKYTPNSRNHPQARGSGNTKGLDGNSTEPSTRSDGRTTLTATGLAAAAPELQKQMLGEQLFAPVCQYSAKANTGLDNGFLAGKVTGMLLEMDNGELLHLLETESVLESKVNEAIEVLKKAGILGGESGTTPSAIQVN